MSSLICNACQIPIHSDEERAAHYRSEWHRYNVKRRCAGLASIPQSLFDQQLASLSRRKAAESAARATQVCKPCGKTFGTASAYQAHLNSKKHIKKAEKQGEAEEGEEEEEEDEEEQKDGNTAAAPAAASSSSSSSAPLPESKEEDEAMEDDEEEEEEGEPIPLQTCLFCSKSFKSVQQSVDHMLKVHGFFIPFIENLTDLEGLLTYLGEKVGIGHVCLWCNGKGKARYPSTQAVQMHMNAKNHCKLSLEEEEDEEELMDYYDFDLEDEEMEDANKAASSSSSSSSTALVVKEEAPRRAGGGGAASINDAGELVLADGSIVGSRQLKHIYKQHVRPNHGVVGEIARSYKQLALTTNVKENPRIARRKKEFYHVRARKREDLMKGIKANIQMHYRDQVMF